MLFIFTFLLLSLSFPAVSEEDFCLLEMFAQLNLLSARSRSQDVVCAGHDKQVLWMLTAEAYT